MAKVGLVNVKAQIDTGTDANCIPSSLLVRAGITKVNPVKIQPSVTFAGNGSGKVIGQAKLLVKFHKDDASTLMKFLVYKKLHPECIIGSDGQDQLSVRIDWKQSMI